MSEDDTLDLTDFVPDTPSPVIVKKRRPLYAKSSSSSALSLNNEGSCRRVLKDSQTFNAMEDNSGDESEIFEKQLSLPGQNRFLKEREEAIKKKKAKEHLSPFKSTSSESPLKKLSVLHGDFVKSSSLLTTQMKDANLSYLTRSGNNAAFKRKHTDAFSSREKSTSKQNRPLRKCRASNALDWPSSSDSSSDDDDITFRFPTISNSNCSNGCRNSARGEADRCRCSNRKAQHRRALESTQRKVLNGDMSNEEQRLQSKFSSKCSVATPSASGLIDRHAMKRTADKSLAAKPAVEKDSTLMQWHNYMVDNTDCSAAFSNNTVNPDTVGQTASGLKARSSSSVTSSPDSAPGAFKQSEAASRAKYAIASQLPSRSGSCNKALLTSSTATIDLQPISCDGNVTPQKSSSATLVNQEIICISPDVSSSAGHDQSINADVLTPETRKAYDHVRQVQRDEDVARQLQEQLDMEFAIALQNQADLDHQATGSDQGSFTSFSEQETFASPSNLPSRHGWVHESPRFQLRSRRPIRFTRPPVEDAGLQYLYGRRTGRSHMSLVLSRLGASPPADEDNYEYYMNLAESLGDARSKGLTQSQAARLPTVTFTDQNGSEECLVCMMEFEDGDTVKILPCFHRFHAACIDKWILKNATCPVCRVDIKLD